MDKAIGLLLIFILIYIYNRVFRERLFYSPEELDREIKAEFLKDNEKDILTPSDKIDTITTFHDHEVMVHKKGEGK